MSKLKQRIIQQKKSQTDSKRRKISSGYRRSKLQSLFGSKFSGAKRDLKRQKEQQSRTFVQKLISLTKIKPRDEKKAAKLDSYSTRKKALRERQSVRLILRKLIQVRQLLGQKIGI